MTSVCNGDQVHEPIELRGLTSKSDRADALETIACSFGDPVSMKRHVSRCLWQGALHRPEHTRLALVNSRVASAVVMGRRSVRFGSVRIPAMTIGPVATRPDFRNRGLAAMTLRDASRYMEENGVLLAYLAGSRRLYERFGYYPYKANIGIDMARIDMERVMRPGRLRPLTRQDIPVLAHVYKSATARYLMTADRDAALWTWLLGPGTRSWLFHKPMGIVDEHGRLCGYLTNKPGPPVAITELVVLDDETALRSALGALVKLARRVRQEHISVPTLYRDPLAVFIRQCVGGKFSIRTPGPLLKIIRFPCLMKRLEPLFGKRWNAVLRATSPCRFTLESEIGRKTFHIEGQRVRVDDDGGGIGVRIPAEWLSGLVTGYFSVSDVAARDGARIPRSIRPVLDVLFPSGDPCTFRADNY